MDVIEKTESRLVLQESQSDWLLGFIGPGIGLAGALFALIFVTPMMAVFIIDMITNNGFDVFALVYAIPLLVVLAITYFMAKNVIGNVRTKIAVDKGLKITVFDEGLFGKKETYEYDTRELEAVEVEEIVTHTRRSGSRTDYDINLVFKGGGSEEAEKETIYAEGDEGEAEKIGKAIAEFAGLKYFKTDRDNPIENMLKEGVKKATGIDLNSRRQEKDSTYNEVCSEKEIKAKTDKTKIAILGVFLLLIIAAVVVVESTEIAKYLNDNGVNAADSFIITAIEKAAAEGDLAKVKDLAQRKIPLDNALAAAATNGKIEVMKYLVEEKGVDVNVKLADEFNPTALHAAIWGKQLESIKYLLSKGAKTDVRNIAGKTLLFRAVENDDLEIAKYLLDNGGDANEKMDRGTSLLHLAVGWSGIGMVRLLVERGADVNAKDDFDSTPFCSVKNADKDRDAIENYLKEHGATCQRDW